MVTLDKKTAIVMVTNEEAILQGEHLGGLVDRVAKELDNGASIVDMQFPGLYSGLYAIDWVSMREFVYSDGSSEIGRPINIIYQTLNKRGYNITYAFGAGVPDESIRISK